MKVKEKLIFDYKKGNPFILDKCNWIYVSYRGRSLGLIHKVTDKKGNYLQTDHIKITSKQLEKLLKRDK